MAKKITDYDTLYDMSEYDSGFKGSDNLNLSQANKTAAEDAVKNYGDFSYSNSQKWQDAQNAYLNRGKFSYDLNGDALYQQYKDNYMTQGKQAMMDTMGQAAAMTGGYGNSYAATVGNQTYQGYLQNLNNVVPELYQMALDRYNMEGDQLLTNYNLLNADKESEYTKWNDKLSKLISDRDFYGTDYNNLYNREYGAWSDDRTYKDTANQNHIANQMAVDNYNLNERQVSASEANAYEAKRANDIAAQQKQYSITDLADVPKNIITKIQQLTTLSNSSIGYTKAERNQNLGAYLDQLEADNIISPAVADALMISYMVNETEVPKSPFDITLPKKTGGTTR